MSTSVIVELAQHMHVSAYKMKLGVDVRFEK